MTRLWYCTRDKSRWVGRVTPCAPPSSRKGVKNGSVLNIDTRFIGPLVSGLFSRGCIDRYVQLAAYGLDLPPHRLCQC